MSIRPCFIGCGENDTIPGLKVRQFSRTCQINKQNKLQNMLVRVKFTLLFIKSHAMKTYGQVELQLHEFVTCAVERNQW